MIRLRKYISRMLHVINIPYLQLHFLMALFLIFFIDC